VEKTLGYTKDDYQRAIEFALNYPSTISPYYYDRYSDRYIVDILETGWQNMYVEGFLVRSCLKWKGIKKWAE